MYTELLAERNKIALNSTHSLRRIRLRQNINWYRHFIMLNCVHIDAGTAIHNLVSLNGLFCSYLLRRIKYWLNWNFYLHRNKIWTLINFSLTVCASKLRSPENFACTFHIQYIHIYSSSLVLLPCKVIFLFELPLSYLTYRQAQQ